jgi:hypothetical protein
MQCPKCKFEHESQTTECLRCGIVFRKFVPQGEVAEIEPLTAEEEATLQTRQEDRQELVFRVFGLPAALLLARGAVYLAPGAVRMLSMWVHEFGHAVAAWLCGFSAMPGPWFTSVDPDRSRATTAFFVGLIGVGGFRAWQKSRWFWIGVSAAVLIVLLVCTVGLYSDQAQQLIIFGGDAGCFVLGSVLMLTFYARRDHPVYRNALRWGFLVIGALSFMDAWAIWSGGLQNVPFGENENGMSDPSVLTELFSWNVHVLIARYYRLAVFCFMALAVVYAGGIALPLLKRSNMKQN